MHPVAHKLFQFAGCTLDVTRGCLRREDREIELRRKSFEVLRYLVENADRLVPKDEIIKAVWPNVFVTDDSLTKCIGEVRLAIGDDEQRIIKTVPRRGYVLDGAVAGADPSGTTGRSPATAERTVSVAAGQQGALPTVEPRIAQKSWAFIASAAALILVITLGAGAFFWPKPTGLSLPDRPSIAVLPFTNISGDAQQDYFSDGVAEDIITSLSKFRDLFVIARNSAFTYRGKSFNQKQISRELGVRYLLEGSMRRDPERLRITTRLVNAETGRQIWAEHYDREVAGIFAVQDELTQKIVVTLVAHITKSELDRVLRKPPEALAAYDYYLRGNALIEEAHRTDRGENIHAARKLYEQSLAEDPRYAPAVAALAQTYRLAWIEPTSYEPIARQYQQQETLDHALALAQQAVALDGNLAEARVVLAQVLHWQYRRSESMAEWQRAFELNPNLAEGRYAISLYHNGRVPEAIEYTRRIMRFDPSHSPLYFSYLGNAYYLSGRYSEALEALRTVNSRLPDYRPGVFWHAAAAAQLGLEEESRQAAAEVLRLQPNFTITKVLRQIRFARQEDTDRLADGLRKAGLPE